MPSSPSEPSGRLARAATWPPRLAIRLYRLLVSPWLGGACRFDPSCSRYADEALAVHGLGRGSWLALRRLARCHPWDAGGHDPVPPRPRPRRG